MSQFNVFISPDTGIDRTGMPPVRTSHGIRITALTAVVFALFLLPATLLPVSAQVIPPILLEEEIDTTPQNLETMRELVNRYEDLREQLRIERTRRQDMYTRAEMDAALEDMRRNLNDAYARIARLESQLKESLVRHRVAEDKARRHKATLLKTEAGLLRELDTTRAVVDTLQVEHLFQVGPTFSPAGMVGALGVINIPGTRLSLVGGANYDVRDQDWSSVFGVTFRFLSQRSIVEGWIRSRSREREKAMLTRDELRAVRERNRP